MYAWRIKIYRYIKIILVILLLFCKFNFVNGAESDRPLSEEDLQGLVVSKSQIEEILDFFSESFQNKIPIDPDAAALQFGYKNFEEFAKQYLKLFNLTDVAPNIKPETLPLFSV